MRIVAGEHRGRVLAAPRTGLVRPTADRLRESIFNVLRHRYRPDLEGARVLDLFAGTGALGLEAMSQGARYCLFVDNSAEGRGLVRSNIEALRLTGSTRVFRRDATALGAAGSIEPFGLVFADPPYERGLGEAALTSAAEGGWLKAGALAVLEESADAPFRLPPGYTLEEQRSSGATTIRFLRFGPAGTGPDRGDG